MHETNKCNLQQLAASEAPHKCVQIVAGPGTGKTFTLVERLIVFLKRNIAPEQIVVMTFTNAAAREILARTVKRCANEKVSFSLDKMIIGTFHSVSYRFLCQYGQQPNVADELDRIDILKKLGDEEPRNTAKRISKYKNFMEQPIPSDLMDVYHKYEEKLKSLGKIDFDDLLLEFIQLLESRPIADRIGAVLIDEFQDTNRHQLKIAELLAKKCDNLTVVGDPDQSIYSFRNAEPRNFYLMQKHLPNTMTFYLQQNYRSSKGILDAASRIITQNKNRLAKDRELLPTIDINGEPCVVACNDEQEEAKFVCDQVLKLLEIGVLPQEIAIISRTSRAFSKLEAMLTSKGIIFGVYGGQRLADTKELKILISYLQLAVFRSDSLAIERTINYPKRGIGPNTLKKLFPKSTNLDELTTANVTSTIRARVCEYLDLIHELNVFVQENTVESLISSIDFLKDKFEFGPEMETKIQMLKDSVEYCKFDFNSSESLVRQFTATWSLAWSEQPKNNGITLTTMHSAKGLEWPIVFIINCRENNFNTLAGHENIEEERRLLYVAATRAQVALTVTYPRYGMGGYGTLHSAIQMKTKKTNIIDVEALARHLKRNLEIPPNTPARRKHKICNIMFLRPNRKKLCSTNNSQDNSNFEKKSDELPAAFKSHAVRSPEDLVANPRFVRKIVKPDPSLFKPFKPLV